MSGPASVSNPQVDAAARAAQAPRAQEVSRVAAVAATRAASNAPEQTDLGAAYGVRSQRETQDSNARHDAKRRLNAEERGTAYDAKGREPVRKDRENGHKVNVTA
jgi:hypothetical protein